MAGLTLTTADSALKEDYQPVIREQLNNTIMLLQQVEKNTTDIEGRRAVLSLHTRRNSGVGARAEGGTLPSAGVQGYAEERVPLRYNYGRIQISGPVIRAMKSDKGSFARAVDSETRGVTADLKRDVNRQLFGTSDGVIATAGTTTATTVVQLAAATTAVQMRQFLVGMIVDIGTVASPATVVSGATITAVDATNKTITIDSSVTTSSSHFVFRSGSGGASAAQKELTGLQTIVAASGTLFNVNPTTDSTWVSTVDSNSGTPRSVSENLVEKAIHNTSILGGADIDLLVTTDGVHRAFSALLTSLKRFNDTQDLKGGYKALTISAGGGNKPLMWDRDCTTGYIYGLTTQNLTEFQSSDWEFMNEDGAVLSRVPNQDAYEAVLFKYHELTTDKRNAHFLIKDVTEA